MILKPQEAVLIGEILNLFGRFLESRKFQKKICRRTILLKCKRSHRDERGFAPLRVISGGTAPHGEWRSKSQAPAISVLMPSMSRIVDRVHTYTILQLCSLKCKGISSLYYVETGERGHSGRGAALFRGGCGGSEKDGRRMQTRIQE